ncbi:MAG: PfkB family carbohydrate kinase [Elusimicrobiales bacterium]
MKNEILVVGSVALDGIESPAGKAVNALGGSAVYFSLSAAHFAPVRLCGAAGADFPEKYHRLIEGAGVNTEGLETLPGKTFRWEGSYSPDFRTATSRKTELNVFEHFRPALSAPERACPALFLANIDPRLQLHVLSKMKRPRIVACDSMNMWIQRSRAALLKLLRKVDIFFVNEDEARQLTGEHNHVRAGRAALALGPKAVVVKKGDYGAAVFSGDKMCSLCAYPVAAVADTTGAGDTFAGGFMGYIAGSRAPRAFGELKAALAFGTVMGSFAVESFGAQGLAAVTRKQIARRLKEYKAIASL